MMAKPMNCTEEDIAQGAAAVRLGAFGQSDLLLLDRVVDSGAGPKLVSAIIAGERTSHPSEEQAVKRAMWRLESLANTSQPVACVLMANLWPVANDLMMHDISDAIDLWISNCDADQLTQQLKAIARSEGSANRRQHYEQVIQKRARS
jgi:hypothetical protein